MSLLSSNHYPSLTRSLCGGISHGGEQDFDGNPELICIPGVKERT